MVWTSGKVETARFLTLLLPSVVNWLVPAAVMFPFIPEDRPSGGAEAVKMKQGARRIVILGMATIATAVTFHQALHLPPFLGMMTGLGFLMFLGFHLKRVERHNDVPPIDRFDIFRKVERVEFDTLLFFFGIITAVGALQHVGYLALANETLYGKFGAVNANITVGVLSAIVDNIPLMYAVLQMDPSMDVNQWLLITLTAGTGGSLLSIGSAAGVAVMGVRRDVYTFMAHLRWAPAVALGYAASVLCWKYVIG
jgi:Na+/H+ antiporter NhaD/arsenite permease-like protein